MNFEKTYVRDLFREQGVNNVGKITPCSFSLCWDILSPNVINSIPKCNAFFGDLMIHRAVVSRVTGYFSLIRRSIFNDAANIRLDFKNSFDDNSNGVILLENVVFTEFDFFEIDEVCFSFVGWKILYDG